MSRKINHAFAKRVTVVGLFPLNLQVLGISTKVFHAPTQNARLQLTRNPLQILHTSFPNVKVV